MEDPELEERPPARDPGFFFLFKRADDVADAVGNTWQMKAACAGQDPDLWQPPALRTQEARDNRAKAINICFTECPVRLQCLEAACVGREPSGVWGGLDFTTRRGDRVGRKAHDFDALSKLPNPCEVAESETEDE